MKRISIVTPSFNQAAYVEETIKSVLGQGYGNLEYIVIDGASTDGSAGIIEKYRPQLAYFVSEPDTGHGNALNKGFRQSTGEIMAWINSDDMYVPWAFKTVSDIFEAHPEVNWLVGTPTHWNDKGAMIPAGRIFKNALDYLSGNYQWIQQESVFWRRSLWEKAGGYIDESYKLMVDGELWTRFFRHEPLWHAQCVLSGFRMYGGNRSKKFRAQVDAESKRAVEAMRPHIDADKLGPLRANYPILHYDFQRSCWVSSLARRVAGKPSPGNRPVQMADGESRGA